MSAPLAAAIRTLAAVCDGAHDQDGAGFNGVDAPFGHRLAKLPLEAWTPAMAREAWETLAKYRRQLAAHGIDYDSIPEPRVVAAAEQDEARQDARRTLRDVETNGGKPPRRIERVGDQFAIIFPYNPLLVDAARALPSRWFDRTLKQWRVPVAPQVAPALMRFAEAHGFTISPEADAALRPLIEAGLPYPEPDLRDLRRADLDGKHIMVRFTFDEKINAAMHTVPGARWDKAKRAWRVPVEPLAVAAVGKVATDFGFECSPDAERIIERYAQEMKARLELSTAADAPLEIEGLGGTLRPFQRAGVLYISRVKRGFIADDQGLGKTVQALAALEHMRAYPAVVVCPASLKSNWYREARRWLPHRRAIVCDSRTRTAEIGAAEIIIVNYDILTVENDTETDAKTGEVRTKRSYHATGMLARIFEAHAPAAVVADECHRVKNSKARRTKAVALLAKQTKAPVRILMSGTALENRPKELIAQLQILDRLSDLGGYKRFTERYCGAHMTRFGVNTNGARHLLELNNALRATCMIRRRKSEVLKELPPKVRSVVPLPIDNRDEYRRAEQDLIAWLLDTADEDTRDEKVQAALRAEQLVRISYLKKLAARGKLAAAKQWVETFLDGTDEKLVLFGHHREIVDALAETFTCPSITGDTPLPKRQAAVDSFQRCARCGRPQDKHDEGDCAGYEPDLNVRAIALNLMAGGVGLTLTAASNVAFLEYAWHAAGMDQAEDRCHRIGQQDSVNVYWLVGEGTIDEDHVELIEEKRKIAGAALDGDEAVRSRSIVRDLVRRLRARGKE